MKYKWKDIIKNKDGEKSKILGVCGEVYIPSKKDNFDIACVPCTQEDLDNAGYTLDSSDWTPEVGSGYWSIDTGSDNGVYNPIWWENCMNKTHKARNLVFKTKSEAITRFKEMIKC